MLLLACISLAVGTAVGAEEEFLTVPTETFRAQAARADDSEGFVEREPLASQLVFQLPPPTMTERNVAGDPGGASDEEGPRSPVPRVGFGRDIAKQAGTSLNIAELSWVATQDGGLAAALGVVSPEAQALRVRLAIKGAPRGLEVRVYDGAGTAETVVSVPRHQLPAAEGGSAELWTPTVPGDAVTVELYLPPGTEPGGLTVSIPRLSHFDAHPQARSAGGCTHTDVACRADEVSDATRRSVAKYLVTDSSGDTGVCTGQLLNDADAETQIPYFLTARHCVENQEQASSMEFHWFYERDTCGGPAPGAATRQTGGARVLAFAGLSHPDTGVDHLLVRLISDPPSGAALAGWTTAGTAPGDTAVGVSHPAGLLKTLVRQSIGGFTGFDQNGSSHILTTPDVNLEGGSSGSGLWKRIDGGDYLVGVLTGVSDDACHGAKNYYGRFDRFYPKVSRWLGVPASVADSEYYPLSRLTLVDAATRAEVADLTAGDAVVDLAATAVRSFDIVAEITWKTHRVALTLTGPRPAAHASGVRPYTLFGPGGGSGLVAGDYRVSVVAHKAGATDTPALETEVPFEVTGDAGDDLAVAGLALVVGTAPRIIELADGANVTVYEGEAVAVRARTSGGGDVGSVGFALSGAGTHEATANDAPFAAPVSLAAGTYRIAATPYAAADGGGDAGTALAVTGVTVTVAPGPVTGFTLVDAAGGLPDADMGAIIEGDTIDLTQSDGWASVRADLAASAAVTSVDLALDGPRKVVRTVSGGGVVSLFGEAGGDYAAGEFPEGAYTLTATPYAGPAPRDVLPEARVAFTVTGGFEGVVAGFTLIEAGGAPPDPDFAAITDGATLSLRGMANKRVSIRAELAYPQAARSVRFKLRGPVAVTRTDNEAPYLLFGETGDDIHGGMLPDGTYTLTAQPFPAHSGSGEMPPRTVTFTIADSGWQQTRVSGFTLIDAQDGPPDPAVGPIGQDATIYWPRDAGEHSIRADLSNLDGIGSVRLRLSGPDMNVSRDEDNDGSPFTVFGDDHRNGDIRGRRLPLGHYYIEATPFSGQDGAGSEGVPQTASFTLAAPDLSVAPLTGFSLVDAGVTPEAVVGTIESDATVNLATLTSGAADIRAGIAAERPDVGSVVFELRGPRGVTRTASSRPFSLFGGGGSALPNGVYTLTATAHDARDGSGDALGNASVTFTVSGGYEAGTAPVTGFTLVDARHGLPDPDLGPLADGTKVDLSGTGGLANVRAELALRRADVGGVVLTLKGPRPADRIASARVPVSLFGDSGGDYVVGTFPAGDYTLTARPAVSAQTHGFDAGATGWTVRGGEWRATGGIIEAIEEADLGSREGKALLDGFEAADLVLEADVRVAPGGSAGVVFRARDVLDLPNRFRGYYAGVDVTESQAVVGRMDDGVWHQLATQDMDAEGPWYRLKVAATGPRIEVFVDSAPVLDVEDATYASGAVGLRTGGLNAAWDDVAVARLDDPDGLLPETAVTFTVTSAVPEIGIAADGAATEGGTATYRVTATPAPIEEIVVNVSVTQGAGDNYLPAAPPDSVAIAADATQATLSVALPDDGNDELDGILTATLTDGTGYAVSETAPSANLAVRDDDVPVVAIASRGLIVTEGGTAVFELWAEPVPAAKLEVSVSVTQGPNDDYLPDTLPTSVTFAARARDATLSVALPDDAVDE
ncbi:MAG: DUF1080 domain-containing protein, partial [Gammaproteobacteria bacterium]|nr:DUF1080 domain-containing protein [Gammaproteobacteria bacterium]